MRSWGIASGAPFRGGRECASIFRSETTLLKIPNQRRNCVAKIKFKLHKLNLLVGLSVAISVIHGARCIWCATLRMSLYLDSSHKIIIMKSREYSISIDSILDLSADRFESSPCLIVVLIGYLEFNHWHYWIAHLKQVKFRIFMK